MYFNRENVFYEHCVTRIRAGFGFWADFFGENGGSRELEVDGSFQIQEAVSQVNIGAHPQNFISFRM